VDFRSTRASENLNGESHCDSNIIGGLAHGSHYENRWRATLTGKALPIWFYVGNPFGLFNSWIRLIMGLLFGIAIIWLAFPYLDRSIGEAAMTLREKPARSV